MSSYSTYISSASKAGDFSTHWNCHHCPVDYHHLVVVGIIILVDIEELSQSAACQWCLVDLDCCLWRRSLTSRGLMSLVATSLPFSTFQGRHLCRGWQHIYTKTTKATTKTNDNMNTLLWMYGAVGSYLLTMPTTNMQTKTTTTSMRTTRTISWWIPCPEYMKW